MFDDCFRYSSSSTERLLASSSSPSLTDSASRDSHNQTFSSGSSIGAQSSEAAGRYSTLSPTPDGVMSGNPSGGGGHHNCHLQPQQSSSKQSSEAKYHHHLHQPGQHQVSKQQSYGSERVGSYDHLCSDQFGGGGDRYGLDRFGTAGVGESRFQTTGSESRYHCTTTERYSPARGSADKYLSLPKSKDRYSNSGRIANSCAAISSGASDRGYGTGSGSYVPPTAHTPVER